MNNPQQNRTQMLKIGDLAKRTSKSTRALRLYEEMELVKPAQRSEKGYRLYDLSSSQTINLITQLQKLNYSLPEIRDLLQYEAHTPHIQMRHIENTLEQKRTLLLEQQKELKNIIETVDQTLQNLKSCHSCKVNKSENHQTHSSCQHCEEIPADQQSTLFEGFKSEVTF